MGGFASPCVRFCVQLDYFCVQQGVGFAKKLANEEAWVTRLREAVKEQHRNGYSLREKRGAVQVQRYWADSRKRESASLPIVWERGCERRVLNALHSINSCLTRGLSLADAVKLTFEVSAGPKRSTPWREIYKRFQAHKIESGETKESTFIKNYGPCLLYLVDVLEADDSPNNGRTALEAMRTGRNGQGSAPGSRGRKLRIQYAAQMLTFAVDRCGLDERWRPPEKLIDLIVKELNDAPKASNAGQAAGLSDEQFLRLYDSIPNPQWKLVVGLLGCFGLRGVELNYATAEEDALQITYRKRTSRGSTKPRSVPVLDPAGRPRLGKQLLLTLSTGFVELPSLGSTDGSASEAINKALRRYPAWQQLKEEARAAGRGRVSCYSLRHAFAQRTASRGIKPRHAAAAMGHSYATHLAVYQQQHNDEEVANAFAAANATAPRRAKTPAAPG